jgi:hypothetical protein
MNTVTGLLPLAIGVAVAGAATLYLLTQGWAFGPWLLAGLLLAHGALHLLFAVPAPRSATATAGGMAWPYDLGRPG